MIKIFKKLILFNIVFLSLTFLLSTKVEAASFELSPNNETLKEGCTYNLDIIIDTEGENTNAADIIINYTPSEIEIIDSKPGISGIQIKEGTVFEFYPGNVVDTGAGEIKMTGSNFISSYNGQGLFGRIQFKSLTGVNSTDFQIYFTGADPYNSLDSNIANSTTSFDMLDSVQNSHLTFNEGSCITDTTPPTTRFKYPRNNEKNIPANAEITLDISDSLSGVDIETVEIILNGTTYTYSDSKITYSGNPDKYSFVLKPSEPILTDSANTLITKATDLSGNYKRSTLNFNIPDPPLPPPPPPGPEPDTDSPIIKFITPVDRGSIPLDSFLNFALSDEDSGINIDSLEIILNSEEFAYQNSTLFTATDINSDQKEYKVIFTPENPLPKQMSSLTIFVEDNEGNGSVKSIIFNSDKIEETVCIQDPEIPENVDKEKLKECIKKQIIVRDGATKIITQTLDPALKDIPKENINQASTLAMAGSTALNLWLIAFELAKLPYFLMQLFFSILSFLGLRKKGKPYGVIYNSVTKEPINKAIVRIYNNQGKLVRTDVTNIYGVFTADLEPGKYRFQVHAPGFKFPSTLLGNTSSDAPYQNLYYGDLTKIEKEDPEFSIPLDPIKVPKYKSTIVKLRSTIGKIIKFISPILLAVGFTTTLFTLLKYNDLYSKILMALYIPSIILTLHTIFSKVKKYGLIMSNKKQPLKGVEIGLKELNYDKIIGKRATDENGLYRFIVSPGSYELVILNNNYSSPEDLKISEGPRIFNKNNPMVINKDVDVKEEN